MIAAPFSFCAERHEYIDLRTGAVVPSITQLLKRAGLVDATFYTRASRDRGTAVHDLCAAYDLGALTLEECDSPLRGYLLAHVKALGILRPTMIAVEEASIHASLGFGGRPDRIVKMAGALGVLELKSGPQTPAHAIQCALQCILVEEHVGLPAEHMQRHAVYLKRTGKAGIDRFRNRHDFTVARMIIREFGGAAC
jgi:hypothetical protein